MAELLGIDQSYYGHILRDDGRGNLRLEHLERLLQKKNVNPVWVMTGEGSMILRISHEVEWENEPTEEQIDALYNFVLDKNPMELAVREKLMFRLACAQCYYENPDANSLHELSLAAKVYLKLISRFPDINLALLFDLQKQIRVEQ